MAVTKNQEYTVTVEGYSGEGAGVARIDGFVVFVSGALRGEVCRVLILKVLKSAAFAKVLEVRLDGVALVEQKNKFTAGETLQWMSPAGSVDFICENMTDKEGQLIDCAPHPKQRVLLPLPEGAQAGDFIRRRIPEKV
mgnify:FL=1